MPPRTNSKNMCKTPIEVMKFIPPILLLMWHLFLLGASVAVLEFGVAESICGNPGELFPRCLLAGVTGGVLYCIRGVYVNFSAKQDWGNQWIVWHLGRPPASMICGGVCYLFLKAGLLLLDTDSEQTDFDPYVYYVLAFMGGYNVGNFTRKLEEVSKAVMGVKESRASKDSEKEQKSRASGNRENS